MRRIDELRSRDLQTRLPLAVLWRKNRTNTFYTLIQPAKKITACGIVTSHGRIATFQVAFFLQTRLPLAVLWPSLLHKGLSKIPQDLQTRLPLAVLWRVSSKEMSYFFQPAKKITACGIVTGVSITSAVWIVSLFNLQTRLPLAVWKDRKTTHVMCVVFVFIYRLFRVQVEINIKIKNNLN